MLYAIALSMIAGALGLYYILFRNLDFFRKHDIPHMRPLPLIGNLATAILRRQTVGEFLMKLYNVHPEAKYVGVYEFTKPVVMLRDIELIKYIAQKHFDVFSDHRRMLSDDDDSLFSKNLFFLRGDRWREVRSVLSPAFTSSKMKGMFKLMSDYAVNFARFVAHLPPEQRVMEMKEYFTRYTNDVIATCAFGVSVDSMRNPNNLFYVYGKEVTAVTVAAIVRTFVITFLPWLARIIRLKIIREHIARFFQDLVETTVRTREEKSIVRPDMLQLMIENRAKKDGKKELTFADMTSQAFVFFLGGFESTAMMMCFAAHEIAVNEDVRKRLQNEIDQVLENTSGQPSYDAVNSMEYMDAVVNETLRMYPLAVMTDRMCTKDFELPPTLPGAKPFVLKKGQGVWIPIYGLQHDPKYFKEPEKFNPDRFLGDQKKHNLNTGAYLPFGLGPRMCIGNRFALLETKVLLFHLLTRCDLLPCEKTMIPLKLAKNGTMKPENDFWLKMVPRKDTHHTVTINNTNCTHEL